MSGSWSPSFTITASPSAKNPGGRSFSKFADAFTHLRQQSGASSPNQSLRVPSSQVSIRCCAPVMPQTLLPTKSLTSA